jgi:hypothetical protein
LWEVYSIPLAVVKRILRYIKLTGHHGLHIHPTADMLLSAFSDADWVGDSDDWRSTGAMLSFLVGT